jgi:ParB family chromosome partitioning protein
MCKKLSAPSQTKAKKKQDKLPEVADLENKLTQSLGTKVKIHNKDNRGTIEIEYYSLDELDRLLEVLMQQ